MGTVILKRYKVSAEEGPWSGGEVGGVGVGGSDGWPAAGSHSELSLHSTSRYPGNV